MNICVIGVGYVGLVSGACFAELGLNVLCVDKDKDKIDGLKQNKIPIYEPGLEEMVARNQKQGRLLFTADIGQAVAQSLVIFIAVGTPPDASGGADLSYIWEVGRSIAAAMDSYKVIVTKSTVPVGTGEKLKNLIDSARSETVSFDVVSNPEFLREGSAIEDFMRPNRVVIGADSQQAGAIMRDLYSPLYLLGTPFILTGVLSAELIKYASNAFLATKISFINEIANICELVGADVNIVAKGIGLDGRIGPKFLHAGAGYGGSCFPKDVSALAGMARDHGYTFRIVEAVREVNRLQRLLMAEKITKALGGELAGKTIAVLGLTFKPNTDDLRDAPSLTILPLLREEGALLKVYDPAGMAEAKQILPYLECCDDAYACLRDAHALVLMTEWHQFRNLDWGLVRELMSEPLVVDLRNIYDPEKVRASGVSYISVGRP
ncbi:MAG: UDP-glucose/GDP-mannose dehydrogenase family protein [Desulfarculales bacterium]|jgi:UDPglucose 6-dehydrogenase|nr:UDP-glucose/GDP-mannose dehydrogenase family protein [Desulfarculales bacterium]